MSPIARVRPALRALAWPVATVVLGFLAGKQWLGPLAHRRGYYAGHYRFFDIEIGAVLTLIWLAVFAVTACPSRLRRPVALRLGTVLTAVLATTAFLDLTYTCWSVRFGHILCGRHAFPTSTTQSDPELVFKHRPGIAWRGRKTPECELIDFRTDENGFRNPRGMRTADLIFIGDSVTEAGEVSEDETFVHRTAAAAGQTAVNLGVFCYGPQQELTVLKRYGLAYQPRTVVWQVTEWNDLFDAKRYLDGKANGWTFMTWRDLYETHSPVVRTIAKLFPCPRKNTVAFERSDGTVDHRVIWPFENQVEMCPSGLAETLRALAEARALCRQRGIEFVVLLVPSHHRVLAPFVKARSVEEELRYRPHCGVDVPHDLTHVLTEFCRSHACPFVDATGDLRRRAADDNRMIYIKDDTHLGVDGHEEVARALSRALKERGEIAHRDEAAY